MTVNTPVAATVEPRLLAGPPFSAGAESWNEHRARLGELTQATARATIIDSIERSGLLGRGGAGFPVGRKWRSVAEGSRRGAVVVANGAEGEPRSAKDRALMVLRPHLVIDGGLIAAGAVGADELTVYVGVEQTDAVRAVGHAIAERTDRGGVAIRLVEVPAGYVSGESTAVVHYLNARDPRPTSAPERPFERGVGDRPTLVQNVESLAQSALIARFGDAWYRDAGRGPTRGTALVTVSGPVAAPGVHEIEYGITLAELIETAGGQTADLQAALIGGYFGGWGTIDQLWDLPLDPIVLANHGLGFGCGLIGLLTADACGVWATEQIIGYMAAESARQCGPCIFGLGAISSALRRLAGGTRGADDLANLARWSAQIVGRGACHHPDGAAALMTSALGVFAEEFEHHQSGSCSRSSTTRRGF
jgi:NADH:ubiquinone oxidoreductase subunit F (NADH-binding)